MSLVKEEKESEAKSSFIKWFYHNPIKKSQHPSYEWDKKTTEPAINAAIASNRYIKKIYKQTEALITHEYAELLDIKLRESFQNIHRKDVATPVGFSDINRASPELKSFFECRKIFERFIVDDIAGHSEQNAQVNAFARWVNIAKLLLKKHNYEAASLVLLRLSQIDTRLRLNDSLSASTQKTLESLNKLIFPSKNFKDMRQYIKSHQKKNDLPPTFLLSKDMTFLNEALGEDKNLRSNQISKDHAAYANIVRKERMLDQLFNSKPSGKIAGLSTHQEAIFKGISEQYQQQLLQTPEDNLPEKSIERRKSADALLPKPEATTTSPSKKPRPRSKSLDERSLQQRAKNQEAMEKQLDRDLASAKTPASKSSFSFFWRPELCSPEVLSTVLLPLNFRVF